jgi:hypothetical protein
MTSADTLMAVKVVLLVAAGAGFAWWQFHDLAQEKKRRMAQDARQGNALENVLENGLDKNQS